jgi:hypothetical protein
MKQQRLLKLSIAFLMPLALLAVLMAAADLAGPAATSDRNPAEFLPNAASDNLSIMAMRAISIPFTNDNSAQSPSSGSQIVARRAFSIPITFDNSALSHSSGSQIVARRAFSIPITFDNSALSPSSGNQIVAMRVISIPYTVGNMGGLY